MPSSLTLALVAVSALVAVADLDPTVYPQLPGPHKVATKATWDYHGICGPGTVYYPDSPGNFPLLSFAHGLFASGTKVTYWYTLEGIASWGYIIVALEGCEGSTNEYKAQEAMMDWAYSHWTNIDHSHPGGIFGHSMGGGSTIATASDGDACVKYGLQAASMMHPCNFQTQGGPAWIPAIYSSGDRDWTCRASLVYGYYTKDAANKKPRGFAIYKNEGHGGTPPSPPCGPFFNNEVPDISNWFGCYLWYNQDSCKSVYNNFCGDGKKEPAGGKPGWGCELFMNPSESDGSFDTTWAEAQVRGDPLEILALPWGLHNGTWEGFMHEIRTRGDWVVQQRTASLKARGLYRTKLNVTFDNPAVVLV